jgi:hypothetical protein
MFGGFFVIVGRRHGLEFHNEFGLSRVTKGDMEYFTPPGLSHYVKSLGYALLYRFFAVICPTHCIERNLVQVKRV